MNRRIYHLVLIGLFVSLIFIGAKIIIPLPGVPFSLQRPFVLLSGILLGPKRGTIAVSLYVLMGLIGIPVFTNGGGFTYMFMPSFGYIIGFIFGALLTGLIIYKKENPSFGRILLASLFGLFVIYAFGTLYFYLIKQFYLIEDTSISLILMTCVVPFILKDIIFCIITSLVSLKLIPYLKKKELDRSHFS